MQRNSGQQVVIELLDLERSRRSQWGAEWRCLRGRAEREVADHWQQQDDGIAAHSQRTAWHGAYRARHATPRHRYLYTYRSERASFRFRSLSPLHPVGRHGALRGTLQGVREVLTPSEALIGSRIQVG